MPPKRSRARLLAAPLVTSLLVGGALVVAAAPAGAVTVSTEAELRAAFDTEGEITLANDITLADCNEGDVDRSTAVGPLTLDGQGFSITQTCPDRVLDVDNDGDLTLTNVTITGGSTNSDGGGLDIDNGALTVIDSQFLDNCGDNGGAIEHDTATIVGSTFSGNVGTGDGGVYSNADGGGTTIVNSTVTGNTSEDTGALDEDGDSLTLVYVTVASNVFDDDLGDCNVAPPSVEEAEEASDDGDADDVDAAAFPAANITTSEGEGVLESFASVVALPIGGDNCDLANPATSDGYNYSDDDSCGFTGTGDTQGGADPQLGELAANGGPTLTRLPASTSPLVDRVPPADCPGPEGDVTTDQRGVTRPQGPGCDIGAVEVEVIAPAPLVLEPTFTG